MVAYLRYLNKTIKGMLPASAAKAALFYVVPVVTYGAKVWYPGALAPNLSQNLRLPELVPP